MSGFCLLLAGVLFGISAACFIAGRREEKRIKQTMETLGQIVKAQKEIAEKLRKMGL